MADSSELFLQSGITTETSLVSRRRFVAAHGGLGGVLVAGCLGDDEPADEDVADDTDDADDVDDADDYEDADDLDETDDDDDAEVEEIQRFDAVLWAGNATGTVPADSQYSRYGGEAQAGWIYRFNHDLARRSHADGRTYSTVLEHIEYQPGLTEITLRDDVYWWSGKRLDAHDVVSEIEVENWLWGGEDLDANPEIISLDPLDDRTIRMALADTWTENYGLDQTIAGQPLRGSTDFTEPWLEQFQDTGQDMDAVGDIREELGNLRITEDEDIVHLMNFPFEFRTDGELGDIGETHWELELVPEKDGAKRAWVDDLNYRFVRYDVSEEDLAWANRVIEGRTPSIVSETGRGVDAAFVEEFDHDVKRWFRQVAHFAWIFDGELHPTDEARFRRAWAFSWQPEAVAWVDEPLDRGILHEHVHPFLREDLMREVVSDEIIESFTDYGVTSKWDRTEEELTLGGFERDADGMWLNKETGEPMHFDIDTWFVPRITDFTSDWAMDMEEFGITTDVLSEVENWRVAESWFGGGMPEIVFENTFGDGTNNLGQEMVEAPPVGEADAPEEEWIEYEVRAMNGRLPVTEEEERWQTLVDQLTWVANQTVPRFGLRPLAQVYVWNNEYWHCADPEETPIRFNALPWNQQTVNGVKSWVGDDEAEPIY